MSLRLTDIFLIIVVILCGIPSCLAINKTPESKIDTTGYGRSVDLIMRRAHKLRLVNLDTALLTCDSAFAKIEILKDERRKAIFWATKAAILMNNGRAVESIVLLKQAWNIAIARKLWRLERTITNLYFCSYLHIGDYDVALKHGLRLLETAIRAKDQEHIMIANFNLGLLYYKLGDSNEALKYYAMALILTKTPVPDMYINIGLCYSQAGNFDSAFIYYKKAMNVSGNHPTVSVLLNYHLGMGLALNEIKGHDSARIHFYLGLGIAERRGDHRFRAEYINALAKVFIATKQYAKALHHLNLAEGLCIENSLHAILKDVYLNFADLYLIRNDYKAASISKEKYLREWQLLVGEDVLSQVALIETEHAERENLTKVAAGKEIIQWREERIFIRENIIWLAIFGSILLITVLFALIRIARVTHDVNSRLEFDVKLKTAHVEESLLFAIQERNARNKFLVELTREINGLLASAKGYNNILTNESGSGKLSVGIDFTEGLRNLEEYLYGFQKDQHLG